MEEEFQCILHTVQTHYNKDMIQLHKFFDSTQKSLKVSSSLTSNCKVISLLTSHLLLQQKLRVTTFGKKLFQVNVPNSTSSRQVPFPGLFTPALEEDLKELGGVVRETQPQGGHQNIQLYI